MAPEKHPNLLYWICIGLALMLIEAMFLVVTALAVGFAAQAGLSDVFALMLWGYLVFVSSTLIFLKMLRKMVPLQAGVYDRISHTLKFGAWEIHSFLCMNNLFMHYKNGLLPAYLRKFMSRLLGGQVGDGILMVGGVVVDPYLVTLEEGSVVGYDALLLPTLRDGDALEVQPILIRRGAVVGARSVLMPGVELGAGAMVKAMSLVSAGTRIPAGEIWGGIPARKMGQVDAAEVAGSDVSKPKAFHSHREQFVTPGVQTIVVTASIILGWVLSRTWGGGLFSATVLTFLFLGAITLFVLWIVRSVTPLRPGLFRQSQDPEICFAWSLYAFLAHSNLVSGYSSDLLPPPLRLLLNQLMGVNVQGVRGWNAILGLVQDPYLVTIEEGAVVSADCVLLPHALAPDFLRLGHIRIGAGAVIGERTVIMPDVTVGAHARVEPFSLVKAGTKIPAHETWGGIPAKKMELPLSADAKARAPVRLTAMEALATFALECVIVVGAAAVAWAAQQTWNMNLWTSLFVAYLAFILLTIIVVRVLFLFWPSAGKFSQTQDPGLFVLWKATAFLNVTNLSLFFSFGLLPHALQKFFHKVMGGRFSVLNTRFNGLTRFIGHRYVTLESGVVLGHDVYMAPVIDTHELTIAPIQIGRNVIVGARCTISAGVKIGAGVELQPMTYVPVGTVIPPGELWGGVPARKIGSVTRRSR